jgi:hypothetical protein
LHLYLLSSVNPVTLRAGNVNEVDRLSNVNEADRLTNVNAVDRLSNVNEVDRLRSVKAVFTFGIFHQRSTHRKMSYIYVTSTMGLVEASRVTVLVVNVVEWSVL